jgi:hypothetical protein
LTKPSFIADRAHASGYDSFAGDGPGTITISGNFACDNNNNSGISDGCKASGGTVRGNIQVSNNSSGGGPGGAVNFNNVGGNVQVDNNSGSAASLVEGNTIGGNLQCAGNTPSVSNFGSPNTVAGNKQGQCAGADF